ncbi:MAG: hypothetical protein WAN51_08740 [Alphaproteobacteria bacterium]
MSEMPIPPILRDIIERAQRPLSPKAAAVAHRLVLGKATIHEYLAAMQEDRAGS